MTLTENRRILVVDDMPSIHEDFRKLLQPGRRADTPQGRAAANALAEDEAWLFDEPSSPAVPALSAAEPGSDYELDSAYQGQEGLARVQAACDGGLPYALAFVDMRMPPGWDGVRTIEALWEADPHLQVVICTAYTEHSWESVIQRLGAGDRLLILKKPFDPIEVQQLARSLVAKWQLARQAELQRDGLEQAVAERTQALRISERAIEAALNPIMITDGLEVGLPIRYVNPAFERITGYRAEEVLGRHPRFLQGSERQQPELPALARAIQDGRESQAVLRNFRKDGQPFWNELHVAPVLDPAGRPQHFIGVLNDVTVARERAQVLQHQARHDPLTGLPNRLQLNDQLTQALAQARRQGDQVAVMWLDLDHFKQVNDTHGHAVGDELLVGLARRLKASVRESDTVARIGGDEFVLVLRGVRRPADAAAVAGKVLAALVPPFELTGHTLQASTSIGIALYPDDGGDAEALLIHADVAMYRAKGRGRNAYQFYNADMSDQARQRDASSQALQQALATDAFELFFQPRWCARTGRLLAVEAQLQWPRPEHGRLHWPELQTLAEDTGLTVALGRWLLEAACQQAQTWAGGATAAAEPPAVVVSLSPRQFRHPELADTVRSALARSALAPSLLLLQFPAGLLAGRGDAVPQTLSALRQLGVRLEMAPSCDDDAGFAALRSVPLDQLRLGPARVRRALTDPVDAAIVRALATVAQALGMAVVADGVESPEARQRLARMGCDAVQDDGLATAVPAAALAAWRLQWPVLSMLPVLAATALPDDTRPD